MDDHPVRLTVTDDLRRSRLTVFFRLLLAIPHFIWLLLWTIAVFFAAIVGWFAALFTTRLPDGLHHFFTAYVRYVTHLGAYVTLAANPYPSFTGEQGYPVDVEIPEPQPAGSLDDSAAPLPRAPCPAPRRRARLGLERRQRRPGGPGR